MSGEALSMATTAAFAVHIVAGTVGLLSGTVAAIVRKGSRRHKTAGNVFFVSMIVMAVSACYLAVVRPNQLVNVFISAFALYLITTGWMAVRHKANTSGIGDKVALGISVLICAPFVILSAQLALGLPPLVESAVPFKGPVLIAIFGFTTVLVIAALSDLRVVLAGGVAGTARVARHLWRMCLGLTLAAGSAFTNGVIRLVPSDYHVPFWLYFVPQFLPLLLLFYWMVRVRLTGWYQARAANLQA